MSLQENKAIVCSFLEAVNKRNWALLDKLMAPDLVNHPSQTQGAEATKQELVMLLKSFPDWHETTEDIIAEGDKVCIHVRATATHTGEWNFLGATLAPTGNKITYNAVNIFRVVDGKIVERDAVRDRLDFFKQLGLIGYTEKGKKLFSEDVK